MQIKRKTILRICLILLFQYAGHFSAYAGDDPIQTFPLLGSKDSVKVNYVSTVADYQNLLRIANPSLQPLIEPNTTHITNIVSIGIEEENKSYIQTDFKVSIVLHIKKYDQSLNLSDEFDSTFSIDYKKAEGATYNAVQYLSFENAYKVEVKIISITPDVSSWDVAKVLRVDNTLEVKRDYVFDCSKSIENLNVAFDNINGELTATWGDPNNGQTEYDLEWAWIDSSAITDYQDNGQFVQEKLFANNATRVTVKTPGYNIPLLYDGGGKLFVRVRPAQIKSSGQRVEGEWTWMNSATGEPVSFSYAGHENNLNWQASTSYAEEGKRKSVVQYFDGTLRNRQTVTKDNTTGTTIVAESYYDYQGRPVIQVLPAPTLNTIIQYSENFNKSINYDGYPKWAYDKLEPGAAICGNPASALSTTTGTAKYYSPANDLNTTGTGYNLAKYIPNSEGTVSGQAYPFAETRFNTDGRIAAQGGVGYTFQLGSGHETKYFYESPAQEELDALFGTDAGLAFHYFKNFVKDANGQYSVSYTDMHGRTVATALAGDTPGNLDSLLSSNKKSFTKQLIDEESNRINGKSIVSSKSLVVPKTGSYSFNYQLNPEQLKLVNCNSSEICYDCIYNLKITINADCNGVSGFPYSVVDSNFTVNGDLTAPVCNENGKTTGYFNKQFSVTLPEGAYTITKTLSLSDSAQNIYRDVFLKNDTCKQYTDFYNETYQALQSQSNCVITCSACDSAIGGDLSGFRANFILASGLTEPLSDSLEAAITAAYNEARANCDRICNVTNSDGMENIRSIRQMMLMDVSPPNGQYASPDSSAAKYNIFNSGTGLLTAEYQNESGQNEYPQYGVNVPTAQLFSDQFKTPWAEQLLAYHPEYCMLKTTMDQLPATYQFEADLKKLDSWTDMVAATPSAPGQYVTNILDNDPFFSNTSGNAPGSSYYTTMHDSITEYISLGTGHGYATLWQIAQSIVFCRNLDTTNGINSAQSACLLSTPATPAINPSTGCANDWNLVWQNFRNLYLAKRETFISKYLKDQCAAVTNSSLLEQGKTPRFIDFSDNTSVNSTGDENQKAFFDQLGSGSPEASQTGQALLSAQYDSTCIGYANTWISQLAECDILSTRWENQATKTTDSTWLVDRLRDVCRNGSDQDHYLGSSSIDPSKLNNTVYHYTDFPSVIKQFFLDNGIPVSAAASCNPYLITIPKPYEQQAPLTDMAVVTKPSDCECTQISNLSEEYHLSGYSGTFSDYLEKKYQTSISQGALDTLLALCKGTYSCVFLPAPIILPPVLQCQNNHVSNSLTNACINCQQYQVIKDSFQYIFNHAALVQNPQTKDDSDWNAAFESFANYKTGFTKTWQEYATFEDSCNNSGGFTRSASCDSLENMVKYFIGNLKPGRVSHTLLSQEGKSFNSLSQLIHDGTIYFPDSVRAKQSDLYPFYNNYSISTNNGDVFCTSDGYSVELRFRNLSATSHAGDVFYTQLGAENFDITMDRYHYDTLSGPPGTFIPGLYVRRNGVDYVLDPSSSSSVTTKWMTIKFKILRNMKYFYFNGNLIFQEARDSSIPIGNKTSFGLGIYNRQGSVDYIKVYDKQDNLKYFEDYNDSLHPAFIDTSFLCKPPNACQTAFTTYYNQKNGTHYSYEQIDSVYLATCHEHADPCVYTLIDTTQTCPNLTNILSSYKAAYANPSVDSVDLDMRTFSGNKTPDDGPKGVFDINGHLIANTVNGTVTQIKQSYASIWNSNAVNQTIGTLELLSNGKFRLHLLAGQVMPCQGIIGMRYYQFDCPNQVIDGILTGPGSYIDFGDGSQTKVEESYSDSLTQVYASAAGSAYANPPTEFNTVHRFPSASLRTITVYHSDIRGVIGFDNWNNDAPNLTTIKNLRGYMPNETRYIKFHSTQDSTINTFENITNKDSLVHVVHINFLSGDGVTPMKNYNFGSFINNPNIQFAYAGGDSTPINIMLPNIPVNFKKLSRLEAIGNNYTDDVKLLMPEARLVNIQYGLQSYQVDSILNQLARSVTLDSGSVYLKYGNGPRTSASDAAVNTLHAKGWYVATAADAFTPIPLLKLYDSIPTEQVLYSEFTDYLNARLHTNYTLNQILALYQQQCGSQPDICAPLYSNTSMLTLCGNNKPVFEKLTYLDTPCKDLDKIAYTAAEKKWQLYVDSVRNVFDTAYYNKCMSAKNLESFTVTYQTSEYHYTLYYYDQAGNLVKTVPPAGVDDRHGDATFLANVKAKRADEMANGASATNMLVPNHTLVTEYRYNTLNQVVAQKTPDAGISHFWYDALGRLVISQNAKQQLENKYSFTEYDDLGRIVQVGEKPQNTAITQAISRSQTGLNNWLNSTQDKEQITRTGYDVSYYAGDPIVSLEPVLYQRNLRNRVSYTEVFDTEPSGSDANKWAGTHTAATYYSYDIHGNVDTLLQDYNSGIMKSSQNRYKKIVYDYDLISGKVNQVAYQPGQADAFYHRYTYDAENRLTDVETSRDKLIWEKDARYFYYKHGPLARTILGQQQVQGIDYAYTLQGWLKSVNSLTALPNSNACPAGTAFDELTVNERTQNGTPATYTAKTSITFEEGFESIANDDFETVINPDATACDVAGQTLATTDMGNDGSINSPVAKDAYSFTLHYFDNSVVHDYSPIGQTQALTSTTPTGFGFTSLFNGNIAAMTVNVPKAGSALLYSYKYDQLNRLTGMDAYKGLNPNTNSWEPVAIDDYKERVTYDANGNILTYNRNGAAAVNGINMDALTYQYPKDANGKLLNNRLRYVHDNISSAYTEDIDNQTSLTLAQVQAEKLPEQPGDNYSYDAIGNLVKDSKENISNIDWNVYGKIKSITKTGSNISYTYDASGNRISKNVDGKETWYVRDASGNVMSIYTKDASVNAGHLTQSEIDLYGSSRLGIYNLTNDMQSVDGNTGRIYTFMRGNKFFELSNHLGNVLATVDDKKIQHSSDGNTVDYYNAEVVSAQDYYPGGMLMPARTYNGGNYAYGFNSKRMDNEVSGTGNQYDYGFRIYDPRLVKFKSVDPLTKKYPELTPYQFASNRPIDGNDLDGLEYTPKGRYGPNQIAVDETSVTMYSANPAIIQQTSARIQFERKQQYFSTPSNNYVSPEQQEINNTRTSDAGYNLDNTKKGWLKLAENKTVNKFANNIVFPTLTAYAAIDGAGELYKFGMGALRSSFALDFYVKQGFSKVKALEHIEGIDLTKKVFTTTLKKGTVIQQWVGENGVGSYFTTLENGAAENLGLNPSEYAKRSLQKFTVKEDTKVLQSTAAPLNGGEGGGTQYFSPELKTNAMPTTKQ